MTIHFAGKVTGKSLQSTMPLGSANANHAPSGYDGAVTSDLGMALLHRIVGR